MTEITLLVGIGVTIFVGATSPGPSFMVTSRIAISRSRRDGLFSAFGMGLGGLAFAVASLLGLSGLLLSVPAAYWVLKILGGIYLIYLGISAWLNSSKPMIDSGVVDSVGRSSPLNSFLISLSTQLSNPKALIIYTGVFATFLPVQPSISFGVSVCAVVFAIETGWYTFVVMVLSNSKPRKLYLQYKSIIDRVSGSILGALGLKLIVSTDN